MPTPLTDSTTVSSVVLDSYHAADLADLLRHLREWIDAEHDQLDPLLVKHDFDVNALRIALDLYAALVHPLDDAGDQPPF